jgi:nucleotide-binding universal stress UspA family protein
MPDGMVVSRPIQYRTISLCETGEQHDARLIVVEAGSQALHGAGLPGDLTSDAFAASETPVLVRPSHPMAFCHRDVSNRILFATDFSETAERAFSALLEVVRGGGGRVDLLHVWDSSTRGEMRELSEADRQHTVHLGDLRRRLLAAGVNEVSIEVVEGSPADEISGRAQTGDYSLIVIGSRGNSGGVDGVLGDVSAPVARDTATPVLLVPPVVPGTRTASATRVGSEAHC